MNIVVTGGNEGIGYYLVKGLLEKNHKVSVLDLNILNLEKLKNSFRESLIYFECDVRNEDEIKISIDKSIEIMGTIDIAIHNACLCVFSPFIETNENIFREVFDVNYFGALKLTKSVIPYMKLNNKGKIIFTSSGVGVTGFSNISSYASSKGSIETLAKCLNIEFQDENISFHLIHPPLTITKSSESLPVPKEFQKSPDKVGYGLAKNIDSNSFIICDSISQRIQMGRSYMFPLTIGRLMSKMTSRYEESNK